MRRFIERLFFPQRLIIKALRDCGKPELTKQELYEITLLSLPRIEKALTWLSVYGRVSERMRRNGEPHDWRNWTYTELVSLTDAGRSEAKGLR